MEMEEKSLSPQEGLQLIADAIAMTKGNIRQNSFSFLLWGWLVAIASFLFFILQHYTLTQFYFLPFPIFAFCGIVITIIYYRQKVSVATISYLTDFLYKMWLVLGFSFFAVVFINVSQHHVPFTYTLIIAAIGTAASGLVMRFSPLILGGFVLFIAAIITVYLADEYKVLVHGIAFILGYIIPGYLLKFSSK
ncbi:hypothetical protein [Taibaiella koreensis]|uniref:hypothetical protein n=1 Tax=Taibaiella koreensis TaxID=1268548 RepID=UPI001968E55C|nr:hypothetical protein [Taibaiella koreensis]